MKQDWGTAEKLYKSEAIDSFGNKYLLGVYETIDEASKAFDEWNKEYEQLGLVAEKKLSISLVSLIRSGIACKPWF